MVHLRQLKYIGKHVFRHIGTLFALNTGISIINAICTFSIVTPYLLTILVLKFEIVHFSTYKHIAVCMANSVTRP